MQVNSLEYWEKRFSTDWKDFSGKEQTEYFATILGDMLPEWFIHEVKHHKYSICDIGCAEGDSLKIHKRTFITSEIAGEDFSEKAIEEAKKRYPEFNFKVSNILEPKSEEKYPVIICSNVLEHFTETYKAIANICDRSSKYTIILIPYREEIGAIDEHEKTFRTRDIPVQIEDNSLVYAKSIACDSIYYPYEQLVLIYTKDNKISFLSDLVEHISSDRELIKIRELIDFKNNEVREKDEILRQKDKDLNEKEAVLRQKIEELIEKTEELIRKDEELKRKAEELSRKEEELNQKEEESSRKDKELSRKDIELNQKDEELKRKDEELSLKKEELSHKSEEFNQKDQELRYRTAVLHQKDEYIIQTKELCNHFATGKLMRLNHFLFRIKGQLLKGKKEDRKEFWSWIKGRFAKTNRTIGMGAIYNPWMVVNEKLNEAISCEVTNEEIVCQTNNSFQNKELENKEPEIKQLSEEVKRILQEDYVKYDVIILSVIDYNFRHQRPQHFAVHSAASGHRVFYVNANFIRPDTITKEAENLYVVDFACKDYNTIYAMDGKSNIEWIKEKLNGLIETQAIRDAIVIVDYPNWVYGAEYINKKYGFSVIADYMDDYTGFLGTAEDSLMNNCIKLLEDSNLIVASSQFLYDVASKHSDKGKIEIIRNGTEVEHFYQALNMGNESKSKKIIGYFGAVAHWFAWEKICYLANRFPMYDIVIIGEVTEHKEKFKKYSNIILLGEKPYSELPKYLADFDVCLIPFDTTTDLIKATNPVKFYEYLSAGKKIVATEIPELLPFKDEYVYMSNEDEQFGDYVKMCLEGTDCLKEKEACIAFAMENDWKHRYEKFEEACSSKIPMVSVIVLTYNNLKLNKNCIDSILNKTGYANYELIIVDNCSTDGTVEYLKELQQRKLSNVTVIFNEINTGFAGGNNIGIELAKGEYVLLLNNDTVITRGWLTAMVKHMENNKKYGMCNPVTNSIGNESMISCKYTSIEELNEFAYKYTMKHMNQEFREVDRLPLFATLIRKKVIDEVGMLDDAYKIGMFEDDDYTEAVKSKGYEIVIAEDAFVHHVNNASFKKLNDKEYRTIFEQNKSIYEKKWNKKWVMPKYRNGITGDINTKCYL